MRPAFHPDASFFGYAGQARYRHPFLFDWIDKNGPAPKIEPRVVSVDILESIAVVRLESRWSGNLAGSGVACATCSRFSKRLAAGKLSKKRFTGTDENTAE